jgi:hypothetical protein
MKSIKIPALLASVSCFVSCGTRSEEIVLSPSGRFEISYGEATQEMDASYQISDRQNQSYRSVSGGADTPPNRSEFFWSTTEKTLLVLQATERGAYDRFLLVLLDSDGRADIDPASIGFWRIRKSLLEKRYFGGEEVAVASVSDAAVVFAVGDGRRTERISLKELHEESRRQEKAPGTSEGW